MSHQRARLPNACVEYPPEVAPTRNAAQMTEKSPTIRAAVSLWPSNVQVNAASARVRRLPVVKVELKACPFTSRKVCTCTEAAKAMLVVNRMSAAVRGSTLNASRTQISSARTAT